MKNLNKPYFCVLPWIHLYTHTSGALAPCCVASKANYPNINDDTLYNLYNSDIMNNLRKNMLADIPSNICNKCYELEKYGTHSHRTHSNQKYITEEIEKKINETNNDGSLNEVNILYFDVRFNNICNYKCVMCGPNYSTKWYEDATLKGWDKNPKETITSIHDIKQYCDTNIDHLKTIKHIYIAGGEPLVQNQHYEFLEWCVDNNINAELYYQSNGSIIKYGKYKIFDLWKKFKRVTFSVSIDGLGYMGEYIRYGFKTKVIEKNLNTIVSEFGNNKEITVNTTFMAYNAYFATEFFDEMSEKEWVLISNVYTQLLIEPEYLQPKVLPIEIKKEALTKIKSSKWFKIYPKKFEQLISNLETDSTDRLWQQFIDYTKKIDKTRNQNILNYFPQLKKYYHD